MNVSRVIVRSTLCSVVVAAAACSNADGPPDGFVGNPPPASDGLLYSVDQITGNLITIDPNTAEVAVVGPTGFNLVEGLTYHSPTDTLLGVDNDSDQLISIDRYTGSGAPIGPIGREFVFGLTYSEWDDTLYAMDTDVNELLTLDPTTGSSTPFTALPFDNVGGLTDDPATGVLYGVDFGTDQVFLAAFGPGLIAPIVDVVPSAMQGVAFDSTTGDLFALSIQVGPEALLRIDPVTDAILDVGPLDSISVASLAFVPTPVPEPTTGLMCVVASLFVGVARLRSFGSAQ